jgi:hypothetical protein
MIIKLIQHYVTIFHLKYIILPQMIPHNLYLIRDFIYSSAKLSLYNLKEF